MAELVRNVQNELVNAKKDLADLNVQVENADDQLAEIETELATECSETKTVVNVPTTQGGFTPVTVPTGAQTVTIVTTGGDTETVHVPTQSTQSPVITEVVTTPNGGSTVITFTAPPVLTGVPAPITTPEIEEEFHPKPTFVLPPTETHEEENWQTIGTPTYFTWTETTGPLPPTRPTGWITGVPAPTPEIEEEQQSNPSFVIPTTSGVQTVTVPTGGYTVITTAGGSTETVHNPTTGTPYITKQITTPGGQTTDITLTTVPTPTETVVIITTPNGETATVTGPTTGSTVSIQTTGGHTETVHIPSLTGTPYITEVVTTPNGGTTDVTVITTPTVVTGVPATEVEEEHTFNVPTPSGGTVTVSVPTGSARTFTTSGGSHETIHNPSTGTPYITEVITTPSGTVIQETKSTVPTPTWTQTIHVPTSQGSIDVTVPTDEPTFTITTPQGSTETVHFPTRSSEVTVITEQVSTPNGGSTTIATTPIGIDTVIIPTTSNHHHTVYVPTNEDTYHTVTTYGRTETVHRESGHTVITEHVTTQHGHQATISTIPYYPAPTVHTTEEPRQYFTTSTPTEVNEESSCTYVISTTEIDNHEYTPTPTVTVPTTNGGSTVVTIPTDVTVETVTTTGGRTETIHVPTTGTPYVTEQITTPSGGETVITATITPPNTWTPTLTSETVPVPTTNGGTTYVHIETGHTSATIVTPSGSTETVHIPSTPSSRPYVTEQVSTTNGGESTLTIITGLTTTHEVEEEFVHLPTFVVPTTQGGQTTVQAPTTVTSSFSTPITTAGGSTETLHVPTTGTPYVTKQVVTPGGHLTGSTVPGTITTVPAPTTETFEEENWQTNGTPIYFTEPTALTGRPPTAWTETVITGVPAPTTEVVEEYHFTPLTGRPPVWTQSTGPLPPTEREEEHQNVPTPTWTTTLVVPTSHGGESTITVPTTVTSATFTTSNGDVETLHIPTTGTPYVTEHITTPQGTRTVTNPGPVISTHATTVQVPTSNGGYTPVTFPTGVTSEVVTTPQGSTITVHDPPTGTPYVTKQVPTSQGGHTTLVTSIPQTPTFVGPTNSRETEIHAHNSSGDEFTIVVEKSYATNSEGQEVVVVMKCSEVKEDTTFHNWNTKTE
jgi:hypothetical protein